MGRTLESEILSRALAHLQDQTGLTAEVSAVLDDPAPTGDCKILLKQGERTFPYRAECKVKVDRVAVLDHVQARFQGLGQSGLLVTTYLSPALAAHCRKIGLSFLDTAGNTFLAGSGLFVWLSGQKPEKGWAQAEKATGAFHGSGLRVVFALLANPSLLQAPYREIAQAAGASLGTTSQSLNDLMARGYLVADSDGTRRWIDRQRVLQTWTTNFPLGLRDRLGPRRYQARDDDWWKDAHPETHGGVWSGEVAAAVLTGELVPKTVTLYLPADRSPFLAAHRLRADLRGSIEVLDAFWKFDEERPEPRGVAPALLVYADLIDLGDPRTDEQARRIHERYLA
jgi:hypothetical protein